MHDFKIKTDMALFSLLNTKQFSFESLNGNKKEKNQELVEQAILYMPITELDNKIYYRARIIDPSDGENTGIFRENGIPVSGYDEQHSGVPPVSAITKNGRVNRIGEQVLYLAEDIITSCKEQKATENDYISVAECPIKNRIKVMDFTIMVFDELDNQFSNETVQLFENTYLNDIRAFYIFVKEYLTSPNYTEKNYAVSLDFLDFIKKRNDISGIKYNSYYTNKHNIALWDENKNSKCTSRMVVKGR